MCEVLYEEIQDYFFTDQCSDADNIRFAGWYDEDGNRIDEDDLKELPEIIKEADTTAKYNVYAKFATEKSVTKKWSDSDDEDSLWPASVTVQLKANDEESETYSLNSENSWTYKWEELPAYDDDGNLIKYTIDEAEIPEGYTKSVEEEGDTVTITNSHTPEPTLEPTAPSEPTPTPTPTPTPVNPTPVPPAPVPVPPMNPDPVPAQGPAVVPLPAETPEPTATPAATASAAPTPGAVDIDDPETPLAPAYWALLNLISGIVTVLIGLGMCITMLRKSDDDDDDEDDQNGAAKQAAESDDEEEEEDKKRKWSKLLGLIPAIGSVILFILTEDIRLPWRWIDKWTIWMIIILLVNVILAFLTRNKKKDDDEEEEEEPARA